MDKNELNDEVEIDLSQLLKLLKKNIRLIIILALVGIIIAASATTFLISKKYQSQGSVLLKADVVNGSLDSTQVNTNKMMVNFQKRCLTKVIYLKAYKTKKAE